MCLVVYCSLASHIASDEDIYLCDGIIAMLHSCSLVDPKSQTVLTGRDAKWAEILHTMYYDVQW